VRQSHDRNHEQQEVVQDKDENRQDPGHILQNKSAAHLAAGAQALVVVL